MAFFLLKVAHIKDSHSLKSKEKARILYTSKQRSRLPVSAYRGSERDKSEFQAKVHSLLFPFRTPNYMSCFSRVTQAAREEGPEVLQCFYTTKHSS